MMNDERTKKVLFLSNGFKYEGYILSESNDIVVFEDDKEGIIEITRSQILTRKEVKNGSV